MSTTRKVLLPQVNCTHAAEGPVKRIVCGLGRRTTANLCAKCPDRIARRQGDAAAIYVEVEEPAPPPSPPESEAVQKIPNSIEVCFGKRDLWRVKGWQMLMDAKHGWTADGKRIVVPLEVYRQSLAYFMGDDN